jgi:hypothetical protein
MNIKKKLEEGWGIVETFAGHAKRLSDAFWGECQDNVAGREDAEADLSQWPSPPDAMAASCFIPMRH